MIFSSNLICKWRLPDKLASEEYLTMQLASDSLPMPFLSFISCLLKNQDRIAAH